MHPYSPKVIAGLKIEEDRRWPAYYGLSVEADRARREVWQPAVSLLVRLLRALASAVLYSRPVFQPPDTAVHMLVDIELARKIL
jgi:hypothetical protein